MMGLSVAPTPAAISDALSLVNAMLDPQQAKRALEELQVQTAAAEKAKADAAAAQTQVDADRAAADKLKAELDAHAQDLATREQRHNAALELHAAAHDKLNNDLAALDASRRSTSDALTRREVAVAAREAAVEERSRLQAAEAEALKTMRQDLEDRLAKIRSFVA